MLTSRDVGRRVVVRRVVGTGTGRPAFTDVIGRLVRADEDGLVVRPDRGDADVVIELSRVVAAKPVPPRRRRVGVEELELLAARAWPAAHTETLGDWLLRSADGWTGRANSALVVGDPGVPLPAAVQAVTDWYRARGLRPACQLPLPAGTEATRRGAERRVDTAAAEVDVALADRGWAAATPVLVLTAPIDRVRRATRGAGLPPVHLTDRPSPDWLALLGARKNGMPPAAVTVLTGGDPTFAEVRDTDGTVAAIGRSATVDGLLGVFAIEVVPRFRRRGLARHVTAALAGQAFDRAHTVFLQVEETNTPARALYERLGFGHHHTYRYRRAPMS